MKYLATIKFGEDASAQTFDDIKSAKNWLDSQNNNLEHTTTIAELNEEWIIVDWFYYTIGSE